jgi:hypothetical protein
MEEKVVGLNKKLICIASQYSGVEILLDSGFFLDETITNYLVVLMG